jgi:secreted PhoX family phosphatase
MRLEKKYYNFFILVAFMLPFGLFAKSVSLDTLIIPISNFTSLKPSAQNDSIHLPEGFNFQTIAQRGEAMNDGNSFPFNFDFTGYVPINGSSENGYLSINAETVPGGVSIMDVKFNANTKRWSRSLEKQVDFSNNAILGTIANCSGTITPWNTIITCEEYSLTTDANNDSYYDIGWAIEINPVTRTIVNNQKIWALGNFGHENIVVHSNLRTAYQGADSNPGYLFKFVADVAQNLHSGMLYVYKGSKNGSGDWLLLNNTTPVERNTTMSQATTLGATSFNGIEDVEISPIDEKIYLAVKGESAVYRFQDSDPLSGTTVTNFETYAGGVGQNYDLSTKKGVISEPWGTGNDNLAFDNEGNLWVLQDGDLSASGSDKNFLWLVDKLHSQLNPKVKIFMKTPKGSEPTGITFSPDNRFIFMSIQHPSSANSSSSQLDVYGNSVSFERDAAIIIARNEHWGIVPCPAILNLGLSKIESGYYQTFTNIQSSSNLDSPKKALFRAQDYIQLNPGFITDSGSTFLGLIGGCSN